MGKSMVADSGVLTESNSTPFDPDEPAERTLVAAILETIGRFSAASGPSDIAGKGLFSFLSVRAKLKIDTYDQRTYRFPRELPNLPLPFRLHPFDAIALNDSLCMRPIAHFDNKSFLVPLNECSEANHMQAHCLQQEEEGSLMLETALNR
jgi:hypothetical protein